MHNNLKKLNELLDSGNPNYIIELHYPDDSLSQFQRILVNLTKISQKFFVDKIFNPKILIKEAATGKILLNNQFKIICDTAENFKPNADYIVEALNDPDDKRAVYGCFYENTLAPCMGFDIVYLEQYDKNTVLEDFKNIARLTAKRYSNLLKVSLEDHIVNTFVHVINMESKEWQIIILPSGK